MTFWVAFSWSRGWMSSKMTCRKHQMCHSHRTSSSNLPAPTDTENRRSLQHPGYSKCHTLIHGWGSPICISDKGKVTYDRLNGVTGWVEGKGIGIHAWNAAGAGGAWGGCSQTGGDTRGDAGCQWAPHWENAQDVLKQECEKQKRGRK